MTRILIVEDTYKHLSDAIRVGEALGLEIVYERNMCLGREHVYCSRFPADHRNHKPPVDGIITDIFMPFLPGDDASQPAGIAVALEAVEDGIPVVLCTAGYHHGKKYNWINAVCEIHGWKMVDGSSDESESDQKNWEYAFKILLGKIEKSPRFDPKKS